MFRLLILFFIIEVEYLLLLYTIFFVRLGHCLLLYMLMQPFVAGIVVLLITSFISKMMFQSVRPYFTDCLTILCWPSCWGYAWRVVLSVCMPVFVCVCVCLSCLSC